LSEGIYVLYFIFLRFLTGDYISASFYYLLGNDSLDGSYSLTLSAFTESSSFSFVYDILSGINLLYLSY